MPGGSLEKSPAPTQPVASPRPPSKQPLEKVCLRGPQLRRFPLCELLIWRCLAQPPSSHRAHRGEGLPRRPLGPKEPLSLILAQGPWDARPGLPSGWVGVRISPGKCPNSGVFLGIGGQPLEGEDAVQVWGPSRQCPGVSRALGQTRGQGEVRIRVKAASAPCSGIPALSIPGTGPMGLRGVEVRVKASLPGLTLLGPPQVSAR